MKILNLFAGIGGNRTLWGDSHEITAIEYIPNIANIYQKRFPDDEVFITDAYEYLEEYYKDYDFIWASPPCYTHTRMCAFPRFKKKLPDLRLYSIIIFLNRFFDGFYVIENVISHYIPLIKPTAIVDRHYIWSNFVIKKKKWDKPSGNFKSLKLPVLCDFLKVDMDLINTLPSSSERNHDNKRSVLRNCVLPEAGKHILDCITFQSKRGVIDRFI